MFVLQTPRSGWNYSHLIRATSRPFRVVKPYIRLRYCFRCLIHGSLGLSDCRPRKLEHQESHAEIAHSMLGPNMTTLNLSSPPPASSSRLRKACTPSC